MHLRSNAFFQSKSFLARIDSVAHKNKPDAVGPGEEREERRGEETALSSRRVMIGIPLSVRNKRPYNDVALRYHPCLSVKLMKDGN